MTKMFGTDIDDGSTESAPTAAKPKRLRKTRAFMFYAVLVFCVLSVVGSIDIITMTDEERAEYVAQEQAKAEQDRQDAIDAKWQRDEEKSRKEAQAKDPSNIALNDAGMAAVRCEEVIKASLHNPASFSTGWDTWKIYINRADKRTRIIRRKFTATNGFGGTIQQTYDCLVSAPSGAIVTTRIY